MPGNSVISCWVVQFFSCSLLSVPLEFGLLSLAFWAMLLAAIKAGVKMGDRARTTELVEGKSPLNFSACSSRLVCDSQVTDEFVLILASEYHLLMWLVSDWCLLRPPKLSFSVSAASSEEERTELGTTIAVVCRCGLCRRISRRRAGCK